MNYKAVSESVNKVTHIHSCMNFLKIKQRADFSKCDDSGHGLELELARFFY